jgi:hypothetical protein
MQAIKKEASPKVKNQEDNTQVGFSHIFGHP